MAKQDKNRVFEDRSIVYKGYYFPLCLGFILWVAYVCWTGYWGYVQGRFPVIDAGLQVALFWWLLDTWKSTTIYRLEEDRLYMLKKGVGHKKELSIPYDEIFGVHHFKNQLMKPITYRYTFHEYAKMDNRPIWSLLYDIGSSQKVGRVLMKASEEFWKEFEKRLPGQIRIPQEEVIAFTYKGMEKHLRAEGYFKDHPEMDFEEGIKQLRQEGTEMGGRKDELTGEDFHGETAEMKNGTRLDTLEAAQRRAEKAREEIAEKQKQREEKEQEKK